MCVCVCVRERERERERDGVLKKVGEKKREKVSSQSNHLYAPKKLHFRGREGRGFSINKER